VTTHHRSNGCAGRSRKVVPLPRCHAGIRRSAQVTRELEQTRILARGERIVSVREAALAGLSESIDSAAFKLRVCQILY
jgi:hypothetical protein